MNLNSYAESTCYNNVFTMRILIICLSLAINIGCNLEPVGEQDSSNAPVTSCQKVVKMDSVESTNDAGELLNPIVLSERKINDIDLPFPLKDMTEELEFLFRDCSINKEIGKQDGPDFPLYSIRCEDKEIGFFAMHDTDTLTLNQIYIKDSIIKDQYGLKVGDDFSKIKENRGQGRIGFDPYHFHMYYYVGNSKISYELTGELRGFDADSIADIVIDEKDIANWKIEYIIWR